MEFLVSFYSLLSVGTNIAEFVLYILVILVLIKYLRNN